MSSRNPLERLRCLDEPSHDFHGQLHTILHGEEYRQYVQDLHGDDLLQLVGYLDEVCRHAVVIIPHSPPNSNTSGKRGRAYKPCLYTQGLIDFMRERIDTVSW